MRFLWFFAWWVLSNTLFWHFPTSLSVLNQRRTIILDALWTTKDSLTESSQLHWVMDILLLKLITVVSTLKWPFVIWIHCNVVDRCVLQLFLFLNYWLARQTARRWTLAAVFIYQIQRSLRTVEVNWVGSAVWEFLCLDWLLMLMCADSIINRQILSTFKNFVAHYWRRLLSQMATSVLKIWKICKNRLLRCRHSIICVLLSRLLFEVLI